MTIQMKLTDLDPDQRREVFAVNCRLQDAVRTDSYIGATVHIGSILNHFKHTLVDYNISSYGVNYLKVDSHQYNAFILGVKEAHETFALFSDEQAFVIGETEDHYNDFLTMDTVDLNYSSRFEQVKDGITQIAANISAHFEELLTESQDESNVFNHFCNYYGPSRMPNAYIELDENGNSDFVLHEVYVRSYNVPEGTNVAMSA